MPQTNVLYAYIGGLIAVILEHIATSYGYTMPADVEAGLPAAIAVAISHIKDMWDSRNK